MTQAWIGYAIYHSSVNQNSQQMQLQRAVCIHEWSKACISALAKAEHFYLMKKEYFSDVGTYEIRKNDLLQELSALIDQGRLLFKNVKREEIGLEKFPARRGYRPEFLDPMVAAYRALQANSIVPDEAGSARLHRWRARFVSLVQYEVDPKLLDQASHYGIGSGPKGGISLDGEAEPPPWPKDLPPA